MAVNELLNIGERIYILGTNHIAQSSKEAVERVINLIHPQVVMMELDGFRKRILTERKEQKIKEGERKAQEINPQNLNPQTINSRDTPPRHATLTPLMDLHPPRNQNASPPSNVSSPNNPTHSNDSFLDFFEGIQQELGGIMGILPGEEMLTALDIVHEQNIPIVCIDLPIQEIFQKLDNINPQSQEEQNKMINDLKKEDLPSNPEQLQELFESLEDGEALAELLSEFRQEFPEISKILIDDRNYYMAQKIREYTNQNPTHIILVLCGAFHVPGIMRLLQPQNIQ